MKRRARRVSGKRFRAFARPARGLAASAALGAFLASFSIPAYAAGPPPAETATEIVARERPTTRSFYGWQILATGGAGGVVAAAATVLPGSPLSTLPSTVGFLVGMPVYVLGGPATHWSHGDFTKGLVSLGGNVVLPIVGGFVGLAVHCAPSDAAEDCGARGFFGGFAIALITAPVVDALVLGWEDIPIDDPATSAASSLRARRSARFTISPAWTFGARGELTLGVAGRF